jgi:uncharacterized membrane protein
MSFLSPQIIVTLVAVIPLLELRASIPLAIFKYGMSSWEALCLGILGSLIPVIPILFLLEHIEPLLRKIKFMSDIIDKVFEHTRAKSQVIKELELLGLILFIGIPLPGTGVWTGTFAAYIFGLPKLQAVFAALAGTTIAGIIMIFLSAYITLIIKYSLLGIISLLLLGSGWYLHTKFFKKWKKKK